MKRPAPVRLDALLVKRGLAQSRERAKALIDAGEVRVDGLIAHKPGSRVRPDQAIELGRQDFPWVGRGALKLLGVLEPFGVDPSGWVCADLGSSTGGFTEVLLEHGAARVYAVDVGRGQLAWKLRQHERVVVMEGVNARHLQSLPEAVELVVGDLSFIGLALILPTVARLLRPGGQAVILVKPQFEVGRGELASGGRVRDEAARTEAIERVADEARSLGFVVHGQRDAPVSGARAGNLEHFLHLGKPEGDKPVGSP